MLISNARVIDGTGSPEYPADLLVENGRIVAIEAAGSCPPERFADRVDAAGLVVCPGFIDVHSHADNAPLLAEDDLTKINQGVTTEVTGNCGMSLAPVAAPGTESLRAFRKSFVFDYEGWHSSAELFAALDAHGTVTNICPLVGHGALRLATIGPSSRAAQAQDVEAMGALLTSAIEAGAFGMSTGLIYPPGLYSTTAELAALASYLPPDRVYATHMRNESDELLASIDEALTIGRQAGCRVHVSHLKSSGRGNWGGTARALKALDAARDKGLPVTQDVYPYDAASTVLGTCLPPWVHEGGDEATLRRLADPADLAAMRAQIESVDPGAGWENLIAGAGGYGGILVVSTRSHRYESATLEQIAAELGIEPFAALVRVLVEEELAVSMVEFCMSERDVEAVLRSPYTAVGSDGLAPGAGGRPHPRLYGTFPRILGRYVRERGIIGLVEAVRRMTCLPAQIFGVPARGTVATGKVADLVCFDPATVGHPGDFLNPALPPTGIAWVMQAGHLVVQRGAWAGTRRGARLKPE
jgi:N-acyl-D-aspartate/D-glutamate deacylase